MLRIRAGMIIFCAGVLTFGIVFTLLQVSRSEAAPGQLVIAPTQTVVLRALAKDSLAGKLGAGTVAIGVPITGSDVLFRDVQSGDRLDVVASLPAPGDGRPVTAVVVRGATVLVPATPSDPLLLQMSVPDAMAVAHLVLGGTRLGYIVWSANGASPAESQPLDERTARSLLGLAPLASQAEPHASPAPLPTTPPTLPVVRTAAPTATPAPSSSAPPRFGGFLYQTQPDDSWESVASTFGLSVAELKHWNETSGEQDLAPRTLLFIPRS
jgi:hypothetical protein